MLKGWLFSQTGRQNGGSVVVSELRRCFRSLVGDPVLTVDLAEVPFLDSTAISVLIAEHKRRVAAGEQLIVTGSSPMALRLFELPGVDQVLDLGGDAGRDAPERQLA